MTERRLGLLTTDEVAQIPKDRALVVQPIGSTEQHGPHLPCLTDALIAEAVAVQAAQDGVWLLPPLSYGKSNEHLGRAGTVSLSAQTLMAVCADVGRSVAASGFRKLVFVNGHGGQPALLDMMARDIRQETGLQVFTVGMAGLGLPAGLTVSDAGFGIHGGELETSAMLAVDPSLVRLDRLPAGGEQVGTLFAGYEVLTLEGRVPTAWLMDDLSASGIIGDARGASKEQGQAALEHWVARLRIAYREMAQFEFPANG